MNRKDHCQWTYAGHELEHRRLSLPEKGDDFLQAREHGVVIAHGTCHSPGKAVTQVVFNVQLARRARCQESVVKNLPPSD